MNFFFGIKNKDLSSQITIPKFQNTGLYENNYNVYEVKPLDKKWIIKRLQCREDDNFFFVDENDISVDNFFFLSNENEITKKYDDNFSKF